MTATLTARRPALTTEGIRIHFPALDRRHNGQFVAYFDGPGGTQVPRAVADAMSDYMLHHCSNSGWLYPTSVETDARIADARQAMADFVNGTPDEIVFGQNMTSLTFHLARGLGRDWGKGDAVIITELDHFANQSPWRDLETERGVEVRVVRMDPATGQLDWDDLARKLVGNVKLLAIGAASNALGTVNDVRAAAAMAKATGALVFVDAVHYAPHILPDVQELGCDFLACSAYKFYGPHIGILWGKKHLLDAVKVPKLMPAPNEAPDRLETGTQSFESIVGAQACVDYMAGIGDGATRRERLVHAFEAMHERQQALVEQMWNGLSAIRGVTTYGPQPTEARTSTVSFTVAGKSSADVARALAEQAVFVSNGDFYATTVVEKLGHTADGLVRAGAACYTTPGEVERLIAGVAAIAAG